MQITNEMDTEYFEVRRGEIYYVDLMDIGYVSPHILNKNRPALVIQNDIGNGSSHNVIVALLTTAEKKPYPFQYKINLNGKDTTILFDQIMTLPKARLIKKVGELTEDQMLEANQALMVSLDLTKYSVSSIVDFDIKSILTEVTKTGMSSVFIFEFFYNYGNRVNTSTLKISLDEIRQFDANITVLNIEDIKKKFDCCAGLNFLLKHGKYI